MPYRSASRGILYTAPPSGDEEDRDDRTVRATDDAPEARASGDAPDRTEIEEARETPTLDPTSATTDANWTGTVPADD